MDRSLFCGEFTRKFPPQWPCPSCGNSVLQIVDKSFSEGEGADSKQAHSCEAWESDWISKRFTCLLKCSNDYCGEVVACVGIGSIREKYLCDPYGRTAREYIEWFKPLFFQPGLMMMDIPVGAPEKIVMDLKASFGLFFFNTNAAANCARMSVEELLTSLGVKRFSINGGKRRPINLHRRIELLPEKFGNVKNLLKAVKWIGNHGSHSGKQVTTEALIDVYDILELALEELYSKKRQRIQRVAHAVNKLRGPRKTK